MLQNREVAGATMGSGRRVSAATFGPYGYLSLAWPVALVAVFFSGVALEVVDPLGLHWSWCALVFIVAISGISRLAGRRGADVDARWRSGPRTPAYWTQRWAPWAAVGLILVAFLGYIAGLQVLAAVAVSVAVVATAAVAPAYFAAPPEAAD
ncbi:hypothetical protein [Leifsonia sp. RAF41]|uniref:hypothetical protein n=1 Tax=Leifsonia sp. RAF41 TaxID=3233056 RepID=UPI003F9B8330